MNIINRELRPYQLEALEFIKNNDKAIIQLPCGTGKSIVMFKSII
jgi:superfamily II DNA or RNA helicase